MAIQIKRAYVAAAPEDGWRVLVERLWPRGLTKAKAHLDLWLQDIAPSEELRRWFNHDPARWKQFQQRYRAELRRRPEWLAQLAAHSHRGMVTLVYAAHDEQHNGALVLRRVLEERLREDRHAR